MPLKSGKAIPEFAIKNQNGELISNAHLAGKKTVLYFYPADNTPTCTEEACNLRDNYKLLLKQGYTIYGVSPDSEKKHKNFIAKYNLPFDLLADIDLFMIKAFKVWGKKKLFGREYMGVKRTTYIISETGIIIEVIEKVEAKRHASQILK